MEVGKKRVSRLAWMDCKGCMRVEMSGKRELGYELDTHELWTDRVFRLRLTSVVKVWDGNMDDMKARESKL